VLGAGGSGLSGMGSIDRPEQLRRSKPPGSKPKFSMKNLPRVSWRISRWWMSAWAWMASSAKTNSAAAAVVVLRRWCGILA